MTPRPTSSSRPARFPARRPARPPAAVAVVGAAAVLAVALAGCSSASGTAASGSGVTVTATSPGSAAATSGASGGRSTAAVAAPSAAAAAAPGSATVTFAGVTVSGASDLTHKPAVTSSAAAPAPGLLVQDVVVGTGAPAAATSTVSVQYVGVLYKDGTPFDASWDNGGQPVNFPLSGVVPGFGQGIGGTTGVPPMHVGGRRIMIFPAALGYGDQAQGPIPAGASLVFVVDLTSLG